MPTYRGFLASDAREAGELKRKIGTPRHAPSPYSFDSDDAPVGVLTNPSRKTRQLLILLRILERSEEDGETRGDQNRGLRTRAAALKLR